MFLLKYIATQYRLKKKMVFNLLFPKQTQYTKFIILCSPRTGSTLLHTYLNFHPNIWSYGEILRRFNDRKNLKQLNLGQLVFKPHGVTIRAVGLKIFYDYFQSPDFQSYCDDIVKDTSIKVIHLVRKDKRAQLKSFKKAQLSNKWSGVKEDKSRWPINLSEGEFKVFETKLLDIEKQMVSVFEEHRMINLSYEELVNDKQDALNSILNFLGVKQYSLVTLLEKQGD